MHFATVITECPDVYDRAVYDDVTEQFRDVDPNLRHLLGAVASVSPFLTGLMRNEYAWLLRRLDDGEIDHHDAEQGRDDQQQAAEDISQHDVVPAGAALPAAAVGAAPLEGSGLGFVDPPGGKDDAIFRNNLRHAELVPIGGAVGPRMPMGNHQVLPEQNSIKRPGVIYEALPARRGDQFFDQFVDILVFEAGQIAAAVAIRRRRRPEHTLLVAG